MDGQINCDLVVIGDFLGKRARHFQPSRRWQLEWECYLDLRGNPRVLARFGVLNRVPEAGTIACPIHVLAGHSRREHDFGVSDILAPRMIVYLVGPIVP